MKRRVLSASMVLILLPLSVLANVGVTGLFSIIQSHGTISNSPPLTVILRHLQLDDIPKSNINNWVDGYVARHPYATAVCLSDLHQYAVWWYGYSFSQTQGTWAGGMTFNQLKVVIDRFHYHGWKVGLETTGIAWEGAAGSNEEYNYIKNNHKELAFTDANGMRATGINDASNFEKDPGNPNIIPDFFKKFTTPDATNNITVGTRLIDLYTTRLKKMILDGLQWDFWMGTDGWNGFTIQNYYWDRTPKDICYSFSTQEENEWGNWTSPSMLPSNWGSMNNIQRANAITSNSTILRNWWYYWQIRFAQLYAQIRQVFIDAGRPGPYYTIGGCDISTPSQGNLSPTGMFNHTLLSQYNSFDYYYTDQEGAALYDTGGGYSLGKENAVVAGYTRTLGANLKPIIGLQPVDWLGNIMPLWSVKQSYLSQAVNYAWINGTRYRVVDPKIIMMQYPSATEASGWLGWNQSEVDDLFGFINAAASVLDSAQPVWLGPTYLHPDGISGALSYAYGGLNYSLAQHGRIMNVQNNPSYINASMGTLILDEAYGDSAFQLKGLNNRIINDLWTNGNLNLWVYYERGGDWRIGGRIFYNASADAEIENKFHLQYSYQGVLTQSYTILNTMAVANQNGSWIISGHENQVVSYSQTVGPNYFPTSGMIYLANFTTSSNRLTIGIYTNSKGGRVAYTHALSFRYTINNPRDITNKILYWVAHSPINTTQPLMDLKVLKSGDTFFIPVQNQKNVGHTAGTSQGWNLDSTLKINATALGLGSISDYVFYWVSNSSSVMTFSDWNNVVITLKGMADVLVIKPLFT